MIELLAAVPWQWIYDVASGILIVFLIVSLERMAGFLAAAIRELDRHREQLRALQAWRQGQADRRVALGVIELRPGGRR